MDKFLGNWKLTESENFDEFLKAKGIALPFREAMKLAKPSKEIKDNGNGTYTMTTEAVKNKVIWTFKLGEEFVGKAVIESDHKMKFELAGDSLVEKHWREKEGKWECGTYTMDGDMMTITMNSDGISAKRVFKRT